MPGVATFYQPLKALPFELLAKISQYLCNRHEIHGYIVDARSLAAFSASSRMLREVAQELLFREVLITSEHQLRALATSSPKLLWQVRELNIFMDVEFYDVWQSWAFISPLQRNELLLRSPPPLSPYAALASVLAATPGLRTLRLRIAESHGPRSAWHKFAMSRAIGTPFGVGLEHALVLAGSSSQRISLATVQLPEMTTLELDGFEDIEPLLALAPNLENLSMNLSGGFPQSACVDLLEGLCRVPKLHQLAFSPEALYVVGLDAGMVGGQNGSMPVSMINVIGRSLPSLKILDLRGYWHGDNVHYQHSLEYLNHESLLASLQCLPNVHTLLLPTSIMTERELITLRLPFHNLTQPDLSRVLLARRRSIDRIEKAEERLINELGDAMPSLRALSLVRPVNATQFADSCITYKLQAIPLPTPPSIVPSVPAPSSAQTLASPISTHFIIRSEYILPAFLSPAAIPSWPFAPPVSLTYTLSRIWAQSSPEARRHLALTYVHDHEVLTLVAASAGGAVIGHIAHKYGEKMIVAGLFAGSALYAGSRILRRHWVP